MLNSTELMRSGSALSTENKRCFLIAEFDSLLILLEEAPAGRLPSVNVQTVKLFIRWKVLPKGTGLFDDNNANVCDYEGNAIICIGSWNAPDNIRQFGSADSCLKRSK
jgi:hypothetical protein